MDRLWAMDPEILLPVIRQAIEVLGVVSLIDWVKANPMYGVAGLVVVVAGVVAANK